MFEYNIVVRETWVDKVEVVFLAYIIGYVFACIPDWLYIMSIGAYSSISITLTIITSDAYL